MTYDEYYDDGDDEMTDEAILESNRISLAPSESNIEEAVRAAHDNGFQDAMMRVIAVLKDQNERLRIGGGWASEIVKLFWSAMAEHDATIEKEHEAKLVHLGWRKP